MLAHVYFLLLLAAAACFLASAFGRKSPWRRLTNLPALGLFFWVLVPLIMMYKVLD